MVLDSNILVSAFLSPGGEGAYVLDAAQEHSMILSPFILAEVSRVLIYDRIRRKYDFTTEDVGKFLEALYSVSLVVEPEIKITVCSDPDDNNVLACAVAADAPYLITRNTKHFPAAYQDTRVITPGEFLDMIRERE